MTYEDDHQIGNYTEPNWTDDEYFGASIQCGRAGVWQKDTLSLQDVDYGHSGSWSMSVWFRHDADNFPGYSREQFIGHGDPIMPTSSNNQFHVQLERSSRIRTIMRDSTDIDRCMRRTAPPPFATPLLTAAPVIACSRADTLSDPNSSHYSGNPNCWQVSSCRGQVSGGSTDTEDLPQVHNTLWHQYLVTTRPDGGEGYNVYIDGVLRAADPYIQGVGIDRVNRNGQWQTTGGGPTDPIGPIRLCGRAKPGAWVGSTRPVIWDPRRYFLGKVAHFAVWDAAMTQAQVVALHNSYVTLFNLPTTPFLMPSGIPRPLAYYYLDEGHGWHLRESVGGNHTAGSVSSPGARADAPPYP